MCFGQKSKITTTTTKHTIKHKNPSEIWESNPGPLASKVDAPHSQLKLSTVVKLFNCLNAMFRNVYMYINFRLLYVKPLGRENILHNHIKLYAYYKYIILNMSISTA